MQTNQFLKKTCFLFLLVVPVFFSCAQTKPVVQNVYAFFIERAPGNIPVGDDGEPLPGSGSIIYYTLYAETSSKEITWDTAYLQNKKFEIVPSLIDENKVEAGQQKNSGQSIVIQPKKGNYLWRLDLVALESNPASKVATGQSEILLTGKCKGKLLEKKVTNLVELYTPPSY